MENTEVIDFIEKEISKYDVMSVTAMGASDINTYMHLTGISSGLYMVKTFIETNNMIKNENGKNH